MKQKKIKNTTQQNKTKQKNTQSKYCVNMWKSMP